MTKSSKKKVTKPKGNSPPNAGIVPHDFNSTNAVVVDPINLTDIKALWWNL